MKAHAHTKNLTLTALFCALVFIATWIYIPAPVVGNVNLGDAAILLAAWTLGGPWAAVAAALGATLADLSSGFVLYAPATFLIKAAMVGVALAVLHFTTKLPTLVRSLLSALAAEATMVLGYFLYEFLVLGTILQFEGYAVTAVANIAFNCMQAAAAIVIAVPLRPLLKKLR